MNKLRGLFALATLLFAVDGVQAQVDPKATGQLYADSFCHEDFCLTGIYSPSQQTINYTMIIAGQQPEGWRGVGQGTQMSGANMLVAWVADNKPLASHRSTIGHSPPTAAQSKGQVTFHNDVTRSTDTNGGMSVISWTFPQPESPGPSSPHVWAYKTSVTPTGDADSATLSYHDGHGTESMDFTLRYGGEAPKAPPGVMALASFGGGTAATGGTSTPSNAGNGEGESASGRDLNAYHNRVWITHMVFMILTWLVLVPAAILVGRFGRNMFKWFPVHRGLQLAAVATLVIGFFIAVGTTSQAKLPHFDGRHQKVGLAIFILTIFQALLGHFGHVIRQSKGTRAQNLVHIFLGLLLFCLAVWNIHLGFSEAWVWWQVPNAASYVVYAWAAVLGVTYLAGMALLPRQLRDERSAGGSSDTEKREERGLTKQSSP
ncbi:unnamed protein product [Parajaminaea phylloscopi]